MGAVAIVGWGSMGRPVPGCVGFGVFAVRMPSTAVNLARSFDGVVPVCGGAEVSGM